MVDYSSIQTVQGVPPTRVAQVGNSIPTTYHANARDVYEEGSIVFPCVKVQENYQDIADVIRMCRARIRIPDQWYGDYLAGIGAARTGEPRLKEFVASYGVDMVRRFPSVSVIDIGAVLDQVRRAMDRAALAVQYVFLFTLAAGITVLLAAIQATRDERMFERFEPVPEPYLNSMPSVRASDRIESIVSCTELMKQAEHCGAFSKPQLNQTGLLKAAF